MFANITPNPSKMYAFLLFFITFTLTSTTYIPWTMAAQKKTTTSKTNKNTDSNNQLDFSFFRKGTTGPVLLVVGGIQGDEPGGFSAATLLATRYNIKKGTLWVIPNLNFPSIIKSSRGVHGDMNRKFAHLDENDPQYSIVKRIKKLIGDPKVCMVLNLHDGSGFYRKKYIDRWHGPKRWGQSVVIDQETMDTLSLPKDTVTTQELTQLGDIARTVTHSVNNHLLILDHRMHVHDTQTAKGDKEMEKSLSWYAVRQGKPAFGLEASKNLSVVKRTYYHLHMLESFAKILGIELERDFNLTLEGVREALYSDLSVSFMDGRITLPLEDVRRSINYLPLVEKHPLPKTSKPIMAVLPKDKKLYVHYGNRRLTIINTDVHELDTSLNGLTLNIDNKAQTVNFGQIVSVKKSFSVQAQDGYRINAIGVNSGKKNENGMTFTKKNFIPRYSIDNSGTIFRIEAYLGKKFCGMILVRFTK